MSYSIPWQIFLLRPERLPVHQGACFWSYRKTKFSWKDFIYANCSTTRCSAKLQSKFYPAIEFFPSWTHSISVNCKPTISNENLFRDRTLFAHNLIGTNVTNEKKFQFNLTRGLNHASSTGWISGQLWIFFRWNRSLDI